MNKEEIAYKLVELYYTNNCTFKNYCMTINDLINKYTYILKILKGDNNGN